jgi:hypothetical protein
VSGADLLKSAGYDTSKGNWFERNVIPIAAEIALDPGSYINPFGALLEGGQAGLGPRAHPGLDATGLDRGVPAS